MSIVLQANTATVAPHQRLDYWNKHVASLYAGLSVDSPAKNFSAHLLSATIGHIGVMRAYSDKSIIRRAPPSTASSGDMDALTIHLQ